MFKKVMVVIGFVALVCWAGILAYFANPEFTNRNLAITGGIATFVFIMALISLHEEKFNSRSQGHKDAYENICAGVDMTKVPVQGKKFFKKTFIFPFHNGKRGAVITLPSLIEEIEEAEFDNLRKLRQ